MLRKRFNFTRHWADQMSSGHRYQTPAFFRDKAQEHHDLLRRFADVVEICDVGCGAGELFSEYQRLGMNVIGIDISPAMILAAHERNRGSEVRLQCVSDTFAFLSDCSSDTWVSCGALGQYLSLSDLKALLVLFASNPRVQTLVLFDCIEPARYALYRAGIGALPSSSEYVGATPSPNPRTARQSLKSYLARVHIWRIINANRSTTIGSAGFAHPARLIKRITEAADLELSFQCSAHYEYRYHAVFRKNAR